MTLLAVRPLGLAFLYALAHPRPAAPVYDEPELPREVANWTPAATWTAGLLATTIPPGAAVAAYDRRCTTCDVSWANADPCWSCQRQPTRT